MKISVIGSIAGVFLCAAPSLAIAGELKQSEIKILASGAVEVTAGACVGLRGNSFQHAAVRCRCLQKIPYATVASNGNISFGGQKMTPPEWTACINGK